MESPVNLERISIAPMMDCTDRHFRYMARVLSKHVFLYTEMIHSGALLYGDRNSFLDFHNEELPLALQLGGNDPDELSKCSKIAEEWGYTEVNLNLGCPSPKVSKGSFGACLMKNPEQSKKLFCAMQSAVEIPVTVKIRTGVDEMDSLDYLRAFVGGFVSEGCKKIIVHARKALLKGLSPKENRMIPPLEYYKVKYLKDEFTDVSFILNGGILTLDEGKKHLENYDGVMIGRAAYSNPLMLRYADSKFTTDPDPVKKLYEVVEKITRYMQQEKARKGTPVRIFAKPLLNFFKGMDGAAHYRRHITNFLQSHKEDTGFLLKAFEEIKPCSESELNVEP